MTGPVWVFDEFELDAARFELRRAGARVPIQPKALDLLLYLARHPDRVVTKDELLAALWPDAIVTEASLSRAVNAARQALDDGGRTQRCIETVRGRGFRFVAPVVEIAPADRAPATSVETESESGFIGRAEILGEIANALASARRGAGGMILLGGEPGIGKTRTAHEAQARARVSGAATAFGWCHEGEGAPALWPWLVLLREVIADLDDSQLADALGEGGGDLATLLPAVRDRLGTRPAPPEVAPEHRRFRLFDTVGDLLRKACRSGPLLIVLDDAQWADAASLDLLRFVANGLPALGIVLLVTYREEELGATHPLLELSRRPACQALRLVGLDRDEVSRLIESELGERVGDDVSRAIHEATEGNPFFARELARLLASEGRLGEFAERPEQAPLPSGVRETLRRRLESLSVDCNSILLPAAAIGRDFELGVLARVGGLSPEGTLELLDEARDARLLRPLGNGYRFAHALVREALLEPLGSAERARLHRRVGEALEAHHRSDLETHLGRIATHLCLGAPAGGAEHAIAVARRAGDRAVSRLAPGEAAEHYARALEVSKLLDVPDPKLECSLLLREGESRMRSGERARGRASLSRAAELARRIGDAEALARAALAFGGLELGTEVGVDDTELFRLLQEGLDALPEQDSALRVRLASRLAIAAYWATGSFDESERIGRPAEEMARRLGDPRALGYALHTRRLSMMGPTDLPERLANAEETLRLARRIDDAELELAAHGWRFVDLVELGRVIDADRELAAYGELASRLRVPRHRWRVPFYRAMRAMLEGRFAEAEELAVKAGVEEQAFQSADAGLVSAAQLLMLRFEQDRIREIEPAVKSFVEGFPLLTSWRSVLGLVHAEMGRDSDARHTLATIGADGFRTLAGDYQRVLGICCLAEVCARVEDANHAHALYGILAPYAPRAVMIGFGVACWGSVDRHLGLLASTARDFDAAEHHFGRAADWNAGMGARPWLAWTEHDWAAMLARRGRPGDAARAGEHLARAEELAEALGMRRLVRRAGELRARLP